LAEDFHRNSLFSELFLDLDVHSKKKAYFKPHIIYITEQTYEVDTKLPLKKKGGYKARDSVQVRRSEVDKPSPRMYPSLCSSTSQLGAIKHSAQHLLKN
jgi:hypothetical protein